MWRSRAALLVLASVFLRAELHTMTVEFVASDCAACSQSGRIRGVLRAELIGGDRPAVRIDFAAGNRVRPGRVRESIEQDGTRWVRAKVGASGLCERQGEGWVLRLFEGDAGVQLRGKPEAGACSVTGTLGGDGVLVAE